MPAPVIVDFILRGMPDVTRAFRTVEQAASAAGRSQTNTAHRGARERIGLAEREAREKVAAMRKADAATKAAQDRATRDVARQAGQRAKAEEKAERDAVRAAERAANERIRIAQRVDREFAQMSKRRERDNERAMREGRRLEDQTHRESVRRMQRETNRRMSDRRTFARGVADRVTTGVGAGISRVGSAMMQTAGMVTQLGGGFGIADSVQRATKNSGQLEDILNAALNPASKIAANRRRREASEVEPQIQRSAIQYGLEREDIQKGLGDITGITGDLETGMKLLPQLAELSRATGSKFEDMAQAAGNVGLAFDDMTDAGAKAEKIMSVMRTLSGQGKAGNVEIRDMAVQAAKVIASSGRFAGDNAENISKMGALMQFARGGGGAWNAASAATAVTAFTSTFGKGARLKEFKAAGIDVFADKEQTKVRAPEEIIADAMVKTKGSAPKMNALFGSVMSQRVTNRFAEVFNRAETTKAGSGRQAILDEFKSMTTGVAMSKKDVREAASRRTAAADVQIAAAREKFDQAVQARVVPALLKLIPVLEGLVPLFIDLHAKALPTIVDLIKTFAEFAEKNKGIISTIAEHPVGALIAMEITKSFASAGLSELLRRLLTQALASGGASPGVGGGAGGAAGGLGAAAGMGAAAGIATGAVIYNAGTKYAEGTMAAEDIRAKVEAYARGDRGDKDRTVISPDQAQAMIDQARGRLDKTGGAFRQAGNILKSAVGDESASKEYAQFKADQALVDNESLKQLITALRENTSATQQNSKNGGSAGGDGGKPGGAAASTGIVQRTQ